MNKKLNNDEKISLNDLDLPYDLKKISLKQCKYLCSDIRKMLILSVAKTGGHLSSNLGVVELTMSIHRNFDSPKDKIIWDVGHQSYVHKILTGRADKMSTLRQEYGISGFENPNESEHDAFISGHSSTSLSVACGISEAMRLQGKDNYTVVIIGDGAMTGGMVYEAMNNCFRCSKSNMVVILNDNNMSISKSVGALNKYLNNLRYTEKKYLKIKQKLEKKLKNIPIYEKKIEIFLRFLALFTSDL